MATTTSGRRDGRRVAGSALVMVLTGIHLSRKVQPGRCGIRSVRLRRSST
jgi:hypothetical protein